MTREEGAAWKALMERLATKPDHVQLAVLERSCILFYGGAAATWADADEMALAEAGITTQRKLVA